MTMCFIYSASVLRTPVVVQSIFLGLAIIPSVIFRKKILNKRIYYEKKFIIPSVILLFASVIISIIPLINKMDFGGSLWIIMYLMAIVLISFDSVMQEKYVTDTNDSSFLNKISFAFYSSVFQLITLIAFCWVELIFGYSNHPTEVFCASFVKCSSPIFKIF